jgi:hypothetical protein
MSPAGAVGALWEALQPLKVVTGKTWDLIPWRTAASTLIVLSPGGVGFAQALSEKQAALKLAYREGCPVVLAWTGQYRTDIFRLDDLERVVARVAPASRLPRTHCQRGHPLEEPNIRPGDPCRECLTCVRLRRRARSLNAQLKKRAQAPAAALSAKHPKMGQ